MNVASSPPVSLSNPSTSTGSSGFGGAPGAAVADATTSAPGCGGRALGRCGEAMASPEAEPRLPGLVERGDRGRDVLEARCGGLEPVEEVCQRWDRQGGARTGAASPPWVRDVGGRGGGGLAAL